MTNLVYYVNFNTRKDFNNQTDLGFACSEMKSGKPKPGMSDIAKKVAAGTIVPARKGDDLVENPELGLYYLPVRIREVDPSQIETVDGDSILGANGAAIGATAPVTETDIPS